MLKSSAACLMPDSQETPQVVFAVGWLIARFVTTLASCSSVQAVSVAQQTPLRLVLKRCGSEEEECLESSRGARAVAVRSRLQRQMAEREVERVQGRVYQQKCYLLLLMNK